MNESGDCTIHEYDKNDSLYFTIIVVNCRIQSQFEYKNECLNIPKQKFLLVNTAAVLQSSSKNFTNDFSVGLNGAACQKLGMTLNLMTI